MLDRQAVKAMDLVNDMSSTSDDVGGMAAEVGRAVAATADDARAVLGVSCDCFCR